jgi:rhamnulokinase
MVDPDHRSFLHPWDMPAAIDGFCKRTDQPTPATPGAYVRTILESLAMKYRMVIEGIETLTGRKIKQIRVIGGGSKNDLLNQFTADATGRRVLAGPAEATALGNVVMQMLADGEVSSLSEARKIVDRSFPAEVFEPIETDKWNHEAKRFQQYCDYSYA